MKDKNYYIHIKPKSSYFVLNVKELIQYRDLIYLFVKRNLKLRYAQTILGPLWLVITPFVSSVVYSFVFGDFAGIGTDGVPQLLFYLSGTTVWALFNTVLVANSNTFIENAKVYSRVYFPRLTTCIAQSITGIINFTIQLAMLILIWLVFYFSGVQLSFTINILLIPVLIIHVALLALAVGILISNFTVKYKDMVQVLAFGVQLWMFLTPIVYPLSSVDGIKKVLLLLNPVTPIVNNFRFALLGTGEFLELSWFCSFVVTLVCLFTGLVLFNKTEKTFADLI